MATRKIVSTPSVAEHIAGLSEPLRSEGETLRHIILSAADGIGEEVEVERAKLSLGRAVCHHAARRKSPTVAHPTSWCQEGYADSEGYHRGSC